MKIKAQRDQDIDVLTLSEEISPQDVKILRVGVTNLLKNGKNKIVLELTDQKNIPPDILREMAHLDLLARELRGRLIICGVDATTKTKIEAFATPPAILSYSTRVEAIQSFRAPPPQEPVIPPPPKPPAPTTPPKSAATAPLVSAALPTQAPIERDQIRHREITEVGPLRTKVAELETEISLLREQLLKLVAVRKAPPNQAAYEEKIGYLEKELEKSLAAAIAGPAKK